MAKYQTFDEYIKGEKIIRYLDCFKRCWNFATEAAVEKFTAANNARDEICPKCGGTGHFHFYDTMTFKDCALCKGTGKLSSVA